MSFEIKPATRQAFNPLIALFAESGNGKTYSALLLARGFVGPTGKIVMVDSENGRGSLYADVIENGYDTLDLGEPFSPGRYIEAITAVEQSGAAIGVLDSGSHEWEGIGGVLDMAGENEQRTGKAGLHNWKTPKFEHAKFVQKLQKSSLPWIICLRAKHKTRQGKDERGKSVIIKDDFTTPLQAEDFIFEMTVHGEIMGDHGFRLTKCSHPSLRACFPESTPITAEHGAKVAAWCANPGGNSAPTKTAEKPDAELKKLKAKLWAMTHERHLGDPKVLEQHLWDEALIDTDMTLATLNASQLRAVIQKIAQKMQEVTP